MAGKIRVLKLFIALAILLSVTVVFLASPSVVLGTTSPVDEHNPFSVSFDLTLVPETIKADATFLSVSLFGGNREATNGFAGELLATYLTARDKAMVIFFNPGGWGWRHLSDSPNWPGIFAGMKSSLENKGETIMLLEYRRSDDTLRSRIDELAAIIGIDSLKAKELAARVGFLTSHIPGLKVILTGESNGTIIYDEAMKLLKDNPRVFSIQTGTPFWHASEKNDRALIMNDNGILPDTFSNGDFFAIISRNVEAWLGFSRPDQTQGTVFNSIEAPGHRYHWQDTAVRSQIEDFLNRNIEVISKT